MSAIVKQWLKDEIREMNFPKKVKYTCQCCELSYTTTRRDMTYPLATFLLALHDLSISLKTDYVYYRDVIKYAKDKYKCTPSDYAILHRWKLIKSMDGVNGDKYKGLTEYGKAFIKNKLRIKPMHYQILDETKFYLKYENNILVNDGRVSFKDVEAAYYEKDNKTPFFKQDIN